MQPIKQMKTPIIAACCLLLATPVVLLADSATDRQIEDTANATYNFRTALDHKVKVKADDGVVVLTGKVASEEQRRIAEDTVENIPGVARVDNRVKIAGESREGSDAWIATKIRSRLLVKANVSLTNTKVDVRDGVVILSGKADTAAQKELTEAYVKEIDGVKSVQNDLMIVEPRSDDHVIVGRDMPTGRETVGDKMDDSSITAQVKYELFSHKSTSALKTKVTTMNGRVVISGDAGSDAEKDLVTTLAKSVRGVESVDNNMTVRN
jgi:hyperosmotically inducible periplasmic protein